MNGALNSFLGGVAVSMTTAGLLAVLAYLWPKILGYLQRVPRVSGKWRIEYEDGTVEEHGFFQFRQRGKYVTAEYVNSKWNRKWNYKGYVASGQILTTFEEEGGEDLLVGVMIFKIQPDGELNAGSAYWHHRNGRIQTQKYLLRRIN